MQHRRIEPKSYRNYRITATVALLCALTGLGLPAFGVNEESRYFYEELIYPATFFCVQGLTGSVQVRGFRGCSQVLEYKQKIDKKDCAKAKVVKSLDDMSPGLAIRAINQKPLDVAWLIIMLYENAPYEYLRVEFSDVTIGTVEMASEDSEIVEETIVLFPGKLVFNMAPSDDYRHPGVSGELICNRQNSNEE